MYDIEINLKGDKAIKVPFTLPDNYTAEQLYQAFQTALAELYEELNA